MNEEHKLEMDSAESVVPQDVKEETMSASQSVEEDTETLNNLKHVVSDEREAVQKQKLKVSEVIGGDFLTSRTLARYKWLFLEAMFFALIYISLRYCMQNSILRITELEEKCDVIRNKATTASAELTEQCRQSRIEEKLRAIGDSTLAVSTTPIYKLNISENE